MRNLIVLFSLVFSLCHFGYGQDVRLVVSKSQYKLFVFRGDSLMTSYLIAVGKNRGDKQRRGDNRTPIGEFTISQIQKSNFWVHDFGDGKGPVAGAYGPWFLRLNTGRWTGIGIHGTHDPSSIGTMATEGCIRLNNRHLEELKSAVTIGTPVRIIP